MKKNIIIVLLCISFALNIIFYIQVTGGSSSNRTRAILMQMNVYKGLLIRDIHDYFNEHEKLPKALEELPDIPQRPTIIGPNNFLYYLLPEEKDTYLLIVSNTENPYAVYKKEQVFVPDAVRYEKRMREKNSKDALPKNSPDEEILDDEKLPDEKE